MQCIKAEMFYVSQYFFASALVKKLSQVWHDRVDYSKLIVWYYLLFFIFFFKTLKYKTYDWPEMRFFFLTWRVAHDRKNEHVAYTLRVRVSAIRRTLPDCGKNREFHC